MRPSHSPEDLLDFLDHLGIGLRELGFNFPPRSKIAAGLILSDRATSDLQARLLSNVAVRPGQQTCFMVVGDSHACDLVAQLDTIGLSTNKYVQFKPGNRPGVPKP